MADEPENLVLVYLRRIDAKVDRLVDQVRELAAGVVAVEEGIALIQADLSRLKSSHR